MQLELMKCTLRQWYHADIDTLIHDANNRKVVDENLNLRVKKGHAIPATERASKGGQ